MDKKNKKKNKIKLLFKLSRETEREEIATKTTKKMDLF